MTCYDIRFPEHARALAAGGAELIVVPAAWAAGLFKEEHWVTLIRARAIENTVWVAAAGQVPDPAEAAATAYRPGSAAACSSIPWARSGLTSGQAGASPSAMSTPGVTAQVRAVLPSLEHRREDVFGEVLKF